MHVIKAVTVVVDKSLVNRPPLLPLTKGMGTRRKQRQHLCLDKAYNSKPLDQQIIKRG
jgi:hypothetical protein